jgi:hypothetical protein
MYLSTHTIDLISFARLLVSLSLIALVNAESQSIFIPTFPPVLQRYAVNGTTNFTLSEMLFGNDTNAREDVIEDVYEKIAKDDGNDLSLENMFAFVNSSQAQFTELAEKSGISVQKVDSATLEKASEIQMDLITGQDVSANHSITANLTQFDAYMNRMLNASFATLPQVCVASKREFGRCEVVAKEDKDVRSALRSVKWSMKAAAKLCESGLSALTLYRAESCQLFALEDTTGAGSKNIEAYKCMRQFQCFSTPGIKSINPWNVTAPETKNEITKTAFSVSPEALGLQSILAETMALAMKRRADKKQTLRTMMSIGAFILPFPIFALFAPATLVTFGPMLFFMMYAGVLTTIIVTPSSAIVDGRIMQYIIQQQQPTIDNIPVHQNNKTKSTE